MVGVRVETPHNTKNTSLTPTQFTYIFSTPNSDLTVRFEARNFDIVMSRKQPYI